MSDTDRRKRFIINAAYYAILVGLVFLAFRYLFGLIWPFLVAFLFAWLLSPVIRWLTAKRHIKHNLAVFLCLIVFFTIVGGLLVLLCSRIASGISNLVVWLPGLYEDTIKPGLENIAAWLENWTDRISPEVSDTLSEALPDIISSIGSAVTGAATKVVSGLSGWATKVPSALLSAIICIIATIFATADFPRVTAFIMRQLPERPRRVVREAKQSLKTVMKKYVCSYGIIMGVTFLEMLVGLLILRQKNPFLIALVIAVFDIFPIVGAGLILVPWGIVCFLGGSIGKGAGLLILWVAEEIVRQYMEPRVVGHQVGLHPLVTLMAMYVGSKLFGGVGLLGLPISCAIVQSLDQAGVIHVIKHENPPRPATPDEPSAPPDAPTPVAASPAEKEEKDGDKGEN